MFKLDERRLFDRLLERERLGSTGIGGGIAIPHGRMAQLSQAVRPVRAARSMPVDFDSIDERPVDIVFLLVAPEGAGADHLKALARVSRLLRDRSLVDKLRATEAPTRSTPCSSRRFRRRARPRARADYRAHSVPLQPGCA